MRCFARLLCVPICLLFPLSAFAAPATHFSVTAPASVNEVTQFLITVTALDQFNNVDTGYTGIIEFTSNSSYTFLPFTSPLNTLTNGTGTFGATLGVPGSWTITATDTANSAITGTSSAITVLPAGSLVLTKTANPMTVSAVGQTIAYSFTVTNHTTQFLDIEINDTQAPPAGPIGQVCIAPSFPTTTLVCTALYTVTAADLANCQIQDTAAATGIVGFDNVIQNITVSNPSTVTVSVAPLPPTITSAAGTTFVAGEPGTFTISTQSCSPVTITGTGTLPSGVTLTDNGNGTATLSGKPGSGTAGQYTITIGANNGMGSTQTFILSVDNLAEAPALQRWTLLLFGALVMAVAFAQWRRAG